MCVVAFIFTLLPWGEGGRRPDEGRSEARTGRVQNCKTIALNWFHFILFLKILNLCRLLRKPSSALRVPSTDETQSVSRLPKAERVTFFDMR